MDNNIIQEPQIIYIYIKKPRPPALIRAQKKYQINNKEKCAEYSKNWTNKQNLNPEYVEKRKQYLKDQYLKRKEKI